MHAYYRIFIAEGFVCTHVILGSLQLAVLFFPIIVSIKTYILNLDNYEINSLFAAMLPFLACVGTFEGCRADFIKACFLKLV